MIEATPTIDPVYAEIDRLLALEPLQLRPGYVWSVPIAPYIDRHCSVIMEEVMLGYFKFFEMPTILDTTDICQETPRAVTHISMLSSRLVKRARGPNQLLVLYIAEWAGGC